MKVNSFLLIAILVFFFNSTGLPFGLTWSALLAPVLYFWVLKKRENEILFPFIFCLLLFFIAHFLSDNINVAEYLIAIANITAIYIFSQAVYTWLKLVADDEKEYVLHKIFWLNFFFCVLAAIFYFTSLAHIFWIKQNLTDRVEDFLRLKMFTYEASYYSMVYAPIFLYFLIQYVLYKNTIKVKLLLPALFLPLIFSFSAGVIVSLFMAGILVSFIHFQKLYNKRRVVNGFINTFFFSLVIFTLLFVFFRDNAVFTRIENILSGNDSSASGRTAHAFILAQRILETSNPFWGIGPGQLEIVGTDIIREYYLYHHSTPVAIPNAAAETLALFGWVGFILRFALQFFFFIITKPWTNYYRLALFFFIFIYQFTGSYITNPVEYMIWVMAFTPAFFTFSVRKKSSISLTA
jgi:hypothetical protein